MGNNKGVYGPTPTSKTDNLVGVTKPAVPTVTAEGSGTITSGEPILNAKRPNGMGNNPGYVAPENPGFGGPNKSNPKY